MNVGEITINAEASNSIGNDTPTTIDQISKELDSIAWRYTKTEKKIEFRFPARPFTGRCVARLHGDHNLLMLVTFGFFVPDHGRLAVQSLMNRLNWNLLAGNFEMDEADGEVRLRYTYPLVNGLCDAERAVASIRHLCSIATEYAPELLQTIPPFTTASSCSESA